MLTTYTHDGLTWVDAEHPTPDEIEQLMDNHGIDPLVAADIATPTPRPRVERYPENIYIILHVPAFKHTHTEEKNQEIDIIVSKKTVITVHYDTVDSLHKFSKEFEVATLLDRPTDTIHAGHVAAAIIAKFYRSVEHELDFINDHLKSIEDGIFSGHEREMVFELTSVGRELINFKQTLILHTDILDTLIVAMSDFFDEDTGKSFEQLAHEQERLLGCIAQRLEVLESLRSANDTLLYTKQNEIMKTLTIMAFVTFPLTLISSVFGMNTQYLPIVGTENDFWAILGIMVGLMLFFFGFFKYRQWL